MYAVILSVLILLVLLCSEFMDGSIQLFSYYDPLSEKTAEAAGAGSIYSKIASVFLAVLLSIFVYLLVKVGLDQFSRSVGNIFHHRRKFPDESEADYEIRFQRIGAKLNDWYTVCRQWLRTRIKRQPENDESDTDVNALTGDDAKRLQRKK